MRSTRSEEGAERIGAASSPKAKWRRFMGSGKGTPLHCTVSGDRFPKFRFVAICCQGAARHIGSHRCKPAAQFFAPGSRERFWLVRDAVSFVRVFLKYSELDPYAAEPDDGHGRIAR